MSRMRGPAFPQAAVENILNQPVPEKEKRGLLSNLFFEMIETNVIGHSEVEADYFTELLDEEMICES